MVKEPVQKEQPAFKRALFVLPKDTLGGAERVVATLVEHAAINKIFEQIDVYILSRKPSGSLSHLAKYKRINVVYSGGQSEKAGLLPFGRFVRQTQYDFCFSTLVHINALCCLLRRLGILRTNQLVTREATPVFDYDFGKSSSLFRLAVRLYGNQDMIICQTNTMADRFNQKTNGRLSQVVQVLPNPVDLRRITCLRDEATGILDHIPKNTTKIVWCGRFVKGKWAERAIQAIHKLKETKNQKVHLVIIGDGPLRGVVEREIVNTNSGEIVTLCGQQSNPIKIMAQCQYGLVTSDVEGFPNVILEMLASGVKAVVTTDCAGGLAEIPGVRISISRSPSALSQCLLEEFDKPRLQSIDKHLAGRDPLYYINAMLGKRP